MLLSYRLKKKKAIQSLSTKKEKVEK